MERIIILAIVMCLIAVSDRAYAQVQPDEGKIGIAEAVAMSVIRHPGIARALAAKARGQADLDGARSVWMPSVSYSANLGPNMSGSGDTGLNDNMPGPGITLNQLIWDFGRSSGDIDAASFVDRQRDFELEAAADRIAETTALAYLDITRATKQLREAETQLQELERLRELIRLRSNAGISDKSDLMLADVRIEGAKAEVIQAGATLTSAKAALANLIGTTPAQYDDPAALLTQLTDDQTNPDFESLPMVASARENEKATAARIGQARAERYPRLGLQLGYHHNNYTYAERDDAFTVMVTVQGDLYRAGTSHRVTAAQQDRVVAQAEKDAVILDIQGRIDTAREAIRGGVSRIDIYGRQEKKAISAREIFIEEYKLGKRSLFDLLNAELEIYRAASARVASETDVMRARVQLYAVHGTLRPALGLADTIAKGNQHEQKI